MSGESLGGRVPLRSQFPILRIFGAAGAALSPASIVIATLATIVLNSAVWICDRAFNIESRGRPSESVVIVVPGFESVRAADVVGASLGNPCTSVTCSAITVLMPNVSLVERLNGLVRFTVSLGLWSLVGLILCRRSAFLFAGDDDSTVQRAIDYGIRRWGASFLSPLIPLLAALAIGLIAACFGLIGSLPTGGSFWLWLISPVVTVLGFAIAFLFIATMASWPLMSAAIATDDCDSFGALSRAFSMLTGRPWLAVAYAFVGLVAGLLLMLFVLLLGQLSIWYGTSATAIGSGTDAAARSLVSPVTRIVGEIIGGIGTAYFWSAATAIYLLLRNDVDGAPYDRIAPDVNVRAANDPLPVVGMPATDAKIDDSALSPIEFRDVK